MLVLRPEEIVHFRHAMRSCTGIHKCVVCISLSSQVGLRFGLRSGEQTFLCGLPLMRSDSRASHGMVGILHQIGVKFPKGELVCLLIPVYI